jgi:hypothetical protein
VIFRRLGLLVSLFVVGISSTACSSSTTTIPSHQSAPVTFVYRMTIYAPLNYKALGEPVESGLLAGAPCDGAETEAMRGLAEKTIVIEDQYGQELGHKKLGTGLVKDFERGAQSCVFEVAVGGIPTSATRYRAHLGDFKLPFVSLGEARAGFVAALSL